MKRSWPVFLGAVLAALVCVRTLISFTPTPWFDVDPVLDPNPFAGLGPAGSLAIDACIATVSGAMLLAFAGRAAMLVALAALGAIAIRLGNTNTMDAIGWRGWNWIVAWIACAAAVAVARNPRQQARLAWSSMVATMLGVSCLWLTRGAWQWFQEHPSTLQFFHENGGDIAYFNDRGWDPAGSQAQSYLRRLSQREMTGWFGLANIFAGVLAVAATAIAGLPRTAERKGVSWMWLSAVCAVAVIVNGSKGATTALCIGFAAVVMLRWIRPRAGVVVGATLVVVVASSAAALMRGTLLAGVMPGEHSLLFRWHYLQTAYSAWFEHPWIGTGSEGFKDASARLRPIEAVEIVQSAHAAFVDWVAQLGAWGFVWIAVSLLILLWSARGAAMESTPLPTPAARDGMPQRVVLLVVFAALVLALRAEIQTLDAESLLVRLVGGMAWAGTAVVFIPRLLCTRSSGAHLLFPAALVIISQAQVEMTLWNPGSCAWLLVMLGAAVPSHALHDDSQEIRIRPSITWRAIASATACIAAAACMFASVGQQRMEHAMEIAAHELSDSMRNVKNVSPEKSRRNAADALRPWSRLLASDQMLRAASAEGIGSVQGKSDLLVAANDADDAVRFGASMQGATRLDALHAAALAWEIRALATQQPSDRSTAMQRALAVTALDLRAANAWLRAARMAKALGRDDASVYAVMAMKADDSFGLDPVMRMSVRDRHEAEALAEINFSAPVAKP